MRLKKLTIAAVAFVATLASASWARPPAELPPASFTGIQYVDSRGCVYIRAGSGSRTLWVPRVNRQRVHICGQQPTATATRSQRVIRPAPQPVQAPAIDTRTADIRGSTRVLPRHVWEIRQASKSISIPKGYQPVWEDDRLNPRRAEQSLNGIARTRLIWTRTVPRRLIDQSTGRDVTATIPLVYPYTDVAVQSDELGTVTIVRADGKVYKQISRK